MSLWTASLNEMCARTILIKLGVKGRNRHALLALAHGQVVFSTACSSYAAHREHNFLVVLRRNCVKERAY